MARDDLSAVEIERAVEKAARANERTPPDVRSEPLWHELKQRWAALKPDERRRHG